MHIFVEISWIIGAAALFSFIVLLLKQPLIIGYIITGIAIGPYFFNLIRSPETIMIFSHLGISLLLFVVGLSMNPKIIRQVGKVSLITGVGQVLFTSIIGFFICSRLGFSAIESFYIALALTFSSTIIIAKLLSDKGDIETLYGKISIGFLIVQDMIAIFVLLAISSISNGFGASQFIFEILLRGVALVVSLFIFGLYIIPPITRVLSRSHEILFLFSISWCLALASLFYAAGFSLEIGAFLAGLTFSLSPHRYEIGLKMAPLRDFFLLLFFILLGSQMVFANIEAHLPAILILSAVILIGNPFIVLVLMGLMGYTRRNSFLAGLTVAQIGEFSLILIALGVKVGHLSNDILSMITAIGLLTIAGSGYLITYSGGMYARLSKYLVIFERKGRKIDEHRYHRTDEHEVILFGCGRAGRDILDSLIKTKHEILVVDHDPEIAIKLAEEGVESRYGDASDLELLGELNFRSAKMVISTLSDLDNNLLIIEKVRETAKSAIVIVVSSRIDEAIELYNRGADYVIIPHLLGGHHTSTLIERYGFDAEKFWQEKAAHLESLKGRRGGS